MILKLKKRAGIIYEKYINAAFQRQHIKLLELEVIGSCNTLLDIGCGNGHHMIGISPHLTYSVGIDVFEDSIKAAKEKKIYTDTMLMDVNDITKNFPDNSFECVIAFDLIEHLDKADGWFLLDNMERIASKKVIVFTPNGFLAQGALYGNEAQVHKSGWSVSEMQSRGYKVLGVHGPKPLLGEVSNPRWRPRRLWLAVTVMLQPLFLKFPKASFQIFCVKCKQQ